MMYEHRLQPLLPLRAFLARLFQHAILAVGIIILSLWIGIAGYHYLEGLSWLDSLLNASMILGGMGPVNTLRTDAGKVFASFYALFSGMIFLVVTGLIFAPLFHRMLHHFHMDVTTQ
jgi:hypothetical protein